MPGGRVIIDPGGGGDTGGGTPPTLPSIGSAGFVVDGVEILIGAGLVLTTYPEQKRAVITPGFSGQAQGDLAYFDGTNWVRLAAGAAGKVLRATGVGAAPGWDFEPARCDKTADEAFSSTSFADVASLALPMLASARYAFRFWLPYKTNSITEGPNFAVNGPASPTNVAYGVLCPTAATSMGALAFAAYDQSLGLTAGPGATARVCSIDGVIENGANAGNLVARAATETGGANSTTVLRGAFGLLWRLT